MVSRTRLFVASFSAVLSLVAALVAGNQASAVTAADWNAGNIVTDSIFYDNNSMTAAQIQNYLNTKVPSCDTYGTKSAADLGYPNITHAQYASQRGWPGPPYVCLRDYYQVPRSDTIIDNYSGSIPAGAISAAQIIKNASDAYGVSPKSLIVLLTKESPGPLTLDTWPLQSQYKNAMGYACPDTAPCDPAFAGFYNQVTNAAKRIQTYKNYPSSYRHRPFQNNSVYYNPNLNGCGASTVYIQGYATAGLYNYTPYQPNQAALNNMYGTGDGCSAYGNRNFWRIYNDWFGSTSETPTRVWQMSDQGQVVSGVNQSANVITTAPSKKVTLFVKAKNTGNQLWSRDNTFFATAHPNDRSSEFIDTSWPGSNRVAQLNELSVRPGEVGTFTFTLSAPNKFFESREYFNIVHEGVGWENDIGFYFDVKVAPAQDGSYNARLDSSALYYDAARTKPISAADSRVKTGQPIYGEVVFENTGGATMTNSVMRLGTYNPNDRTSQFKSPDWLSDNRVASMVESSVKPGEKGRIRFTLSAPSPNWYTESFAVLAEGVTWLPDTATKFRVEVIPNYQASMISGQTIVTGRQIVSDNLKYRLIIQPDGNLVLYNNSAPIWHANTVGSAAPTLVMQSDGNLVLYAQGSVPVWNSRTVTGLYSMLRLQDDGNLVMYANGNNPKWSTGTSGR